MRDDLPLELDKANPEDRAVLETILKERLYQMGIGRNWDISGLKTLYVTENTQRLLKSYGLLIETVLTLYDEDGGLSAYDYIQKALTALEGSLFERGIVVKY